MSTTAHAPSDDGHDSRNRSGSHSIGDSFTFSIVMSGSCRCAYGFFSAFRRSFTATCQPMYSGAPVCSMYARIHGANAPPAPMPPTAAAGQAPLRVALALLLPRDREHALVDAATR